MAAMTRLDAFATADFHSVVVAVAVVVVAVFASGSEVTLAGKRTDEFFSEDSLLRNRMPSNLRGSDTRSTRAQSSRPLFAPAAQGKRRKGEVDAYLPAARRSASAFDWLFLSDARAANEPISMP